jgi:tRNA (cmo5U34)-methyltransferase
MTDKAIGVFDAHAGDYEALRRRLVPSFDAFYGSAVGALALAGCELRRVLDLGAGTGMLARAVLQANPDSEVVLLDGSAAMLDQARRALGDRVSYVVGDLGSELPAGPWDAVVSALAIHHLGDAGKRELFARVRAALSLGGVFVNAEQVAGPTALLDAAYLRWHERRARELGASDTEWASSVERMRVDHNATVKQQLAWLGEAGFAHADCLFKDHRLAVLAGIAAGPPPASGATMSPADDRPRAPTPG